MLLDELTVPQHHGPRCIAPHMIIVSGRRSSTSLLVPISKIRSGDDNPQQRKLGKYTQSDGNKLEHSSGLDTVSTQSSYSSLESQEPEEFKHKEFSTYSESQQQEAMNSSSSSCNNEPPRCNTNNHSHNHEALPELAGDSGNASSAASFTSPTVLPNTQCTKQQGRVRLASASGYPRRASMPASSSIRDKPQTKSVRFGNVQLVLTDSLRSAGHKNDDDDGNDNNAMDDYVSLPARWHDCSEYSVDEYEEKLSHSRQQRKRKGIHRLEYEKTKLELLEYKLMSSITRHQLRSAQNQNTQQQKEQRLENNDSTTTTTTTVTSTTCSTIKNSSGNNNSNKNNNHRTATTIIVPTLMRNNMNDLIMIPLRLRRWRRAAIKRRKKIQSLLGAVTSTTTKPSSPSRQLPQPSPPLLDENQQEHDHQAGVAELLV